jgi:hypothetical protein
MGYTLKSKSIPNRPPWNGPLERVLQMGEKEKMKRYGFSRSYKQPRAKMNNQTRKKAVLPRTETWFTEAIYLQVMVCHVYLFFA